MSTIFALSTATGKSAVAVVRVSGPQSLTMLQSLSGTRMPIIHRQAQLRSLRHPESKEILDRAITLFSYGPRTFTGEDTCELHLHGSKAVINAVLEAVPRCATQIRHALPGEFSKRAFFNGKMDLTQAEGLADLINSETEEQRRSAFRQSEGALSKLYSTWQLQLLDMRSSLEAVIDFGDDNDDIEVSIVEKVYQQAMLLRKDLQRHLQSSMRGEMLREGIRAVIFGPPNAGKSSLLNLLTQRDASIVSTEAGTTRDVVECLVDIGGYPVVLGDTAGLREEARVGIVEKEGIRRARSRISKADLRLCVVPPDHRFDSSILHVLQAQSSSPADQKSFMLIVNKSDTTTPESIERHRAYLSRITGVAGTSICYISCVTRDGIPSFLAAMRERLQTLTSDSEGARQGLTSLSSNARHRVQIQKCLEHLGHFLHEYNTTDADTIVFAAEELRYASDSLGRITGKIDVEEILGQIFANFCIGK